MRMARRDGIPYLTFPHLAEAGVPHAMFTRIGGVSPSPFQSLNTSRSGGDSAENVAENRRRIGEVMDRIASSLVMPGDSSGRLAFLRQIHGVAVAAMEETTPVDEVPEADAAMTDVPGLGLVIQTADCQPVMLFDSRTRAVANIHSGWRSSVANIIGHTVAAMTARYGTDPADLLAGVGPSLGPCCAEFIHYEREIPAPFWSHRVSEHHFDFWAISRRQLTEAGVRDDRIVIAGICTRCRPDLFFSYREEKITGRMASVIRSGNGPKIGPENGKDRP